MAKTPQPRITASPRPSAGEWPVLRACWRAGPRAPIGEIVRELQNDTHFEYRHAQTMLRRLAAKGYLKVGKRGPRRNVYTSLRPPDETRREAMRLFLSRVVGREPENVQILRKMLDHVESHGPYVDASSLPRDVRVRLIALVEGLIGRKRDRRALAAALGLEARALDRSPRLAGAISLLSAAGGDTTGAAKKLLDAIEELLEDDEGQEAREIFAIRRKLEALPAS